MAVTTTALLAAGATAAGAGISAYGSYQQSKTTEKIAEYNSKIGKHNAQRQRTNAAIVTEQGLERAERKRRQQRRFRGSQITQIMSSGTTMSGSFLDILNDSSVEMEEQILTDLYKTNLQAYGYQDRADMLEDTADFIKYKGSAEAGQQRLQAIGTIIGGLGSAASMVGTPTPTPTTSTGGVAIA